MDEAADTLDEAYERLHATGPEFQGWLSNHGPMAVEAMVRHGHADEVEGWVDRYVRRLEEPPDAGRPVGDEEWRAAMGDPRRLGDWRERFTREVAERPWREVLAVWWPRLLPGIAAGATHGVIRTGHATRSLLALETPLRRAELAHALAYWAARWQYVEGPPVGRDGADTAIALHGIPPVPDRSGGIRHRLGQLPEVQAWPSALAALRPPRTPEEVPGRLAELVEAATLRYLSHGHGNGVMLVHTATAPNAVLRALEALPRELWIPSFSAAWTATAALTAAYRPDGPAPADQLPATPAGPSEALRRAVEHGDEHAIKFADTALDVHLRTGDPAALAAAARATLLIKR